MRGKSSKNSRRIVVALAFTLGACGGGGSSEPDALDGSRVRLTGAVFDFAALTPIEGIEVCLFEDDTTPCDVSDANGRYEITAEKNSEVLVRYTGSGYFTKLWHRRIEDVDEDLTIFNLQTTERIAQQFAAVSVTPDPGRGHLAIQIVGAIEGATASLVPAVGEGPFYGGPNEDLDPQLTSATEVGFGVAVFANVPPGSYSIVVASSGATCVSRETPGAEPQSSLGRSVAGLLSETSIECD